MNYSPNDYKPLLDKIKEIDTDLSDIIDINFETDIEEARDYIVSLDKKINDSTLNIKMLTNESTYELYSLMYRDFFESKRRYVELVNIGYEEDVFPFDEWLHITADLKWINVNNINIAREFANLEEDKEIKVQLMRNIEYLWSSVEKTVSETNDKRRFFSDCIELSKNLPPEYKEDFVERFIFTNSVDVNLINFLEDKKELQDYKIDLNKVGYYIDYLFNKTSVNDNKLNEVFKLLQTYGNDLIANKISHILIGEHSNSFLTFHQSKLHQVNNNNLEKLFEFDIDYNTGFSKHILRNLKTVQSRIYSTDKSKLDNIILYFERGCAANDLAKKIPQKEEVIRLRKI